MSDSSQLDELRAKFGVGEVRLSKVAGQIVGVTGLLVSASMPDAFLGEVCEIHGRRCEASVPAEVVGFRHGETLLMPLGELRGVGIGSQVTTSGDCLRVPVSDDLLGRILDGLGQPIDGKAAVRPERLEPVIRESPHPYQRRRIRIQLPVGVKAIDAMLPIGQGQRMGIFAAAGGGKSTLMGMIARYSEADVKVIVLIGERGREVREFIEDNLQDGLKSSVVVVATADRPSVVRMKSAYIGTTIAEYLRDQGKKVILMMDSVTRFARALREIGLARGEPPARYGFPPSVFAELPRLFERCGNSEGSGSLTGFYTVLVEGDDFNEPVADETKSLLDGHILLSPKTPYYPRIHMLGSESRVRSTLELPPEVRAAHRRVYDFMQRYQQKEQALEFGALEKDEANRLRAGIAAVREFLKQDEQTRFAIAGTRAEFVKLSQQIEPALK